MAAALPALRGPRSTPMRRAPTSASVQPHHDCAWPAIEKASEQSGVPLRICAAPPLLALQTKQRSKAGGIAYRLHGAAEKPSWSPTPLANAWPTAELDQAPTGNAKIPSPTGTASAVKLRLAVPPDNRGAIHRRPASRPVLFWVDIGDQLSASGWHRTLHPPLPAA